MQPKKDMTTMAESYIVVTAEDATITTAPSTNSTIVARAQQGDVFQVHGVTAQWYEIGMFSSTCRYLPRSQAQEITPDHGSLPTDSTTRHTLFRAIVAAETQARTEALQGENVALHIGHDDLVDLLIDRYTLQVFHAFKVCASEYEVIAAEGLAKGWYIAA